MGSHRARAPLRVGRTRGAGQPESSYVAAMPSMPGGRPVTTPTLVRVPSAFTRYSSTVPAVPVSPYRYRPSLDAVRSIGPASVVATIPLGVTSDGSPAASIRYALSVLLPVLAT